MTYGPDIKQVAAMMNERVEELVHALGLRGERQGQEFVAYNPTRADKHLGSFRIVLAGSKQGVFKDFADTEVGGDALDLVCYCRGLTKADGFKWAKEFLGIDEQRGRPPRASGGRGAPQPAPAAPPETPTSDAERRAEHAQKAKALWLAGVPIAGTMADRYLFCRGIDIRRLGRQPGALRFHAQCWCSETGTKLPALVSLIFGPGFAPVAVHRTYLEERGGGAAGKASLKDPKKTYGLYRGGYIPVWRGASGLPIGKAPPEDKIAITEGIEDALTVALAAPEYRVIAAISVGNVANIALPPEFKEILIVKDNDAPGSPAARTLDHAIAVLTEQGRTVRLLTPPHGCKDVNAWLLRSAA